MSENSILYFLQKSVEFLEKKQISKARLDAELILADILKVPRIRLYSEFDKKLTEEQKSKYREKIIERSQKKPTAYIIGKKDFFKSTFFVNETVLIPRPETEELVEYILNNKDLNLESELHILDLCCGSGCIGISLKKELKQVKVSFVDISEKALEVAQKNASILLPDENETLTFTCSDLYKNLNTEKFDLIVCNPPYILESEKEQMTPDVLEYEPHIALFIEESNFSFKDLIQHSFEHLNENGFLFLEINPNIIEEILENSKQFKSQKIIKDYSQKKRFLQLQK